MKTQVNVGSYLLFFSIHFKLVDAYLFFTITIILICYLGFFQMFLTTKYLL